MLQDLDFQQQKATILYSNSQSTIHLAINSKLHSQTKYFDINYYIICKQIKNHNL